MDEPIEVFAEDQFHRLAHQVMGVVFGVHNEYGRLLDEDVYQWNIRDRCERAGICPARREVKIAVTHQDFQKLYYMDLLFANGLMLETKVVRQSNDEHRAQSLQYLMLTGMKHGLLVNLRTAEVQKEFVSTTLDLTERRRATATDLDWMEINPASKKLRMIFDRLIKDWGAFLQVSLYREAIIHFFGGPEKVQNRIPVFAEDSHAGTHEVSLLADDTALALTAIKSNKERFRDHLERFLSHTALEYIQWINMDNHDIEYRTLVRSIR